MDLLLLLIYVAFAYGVFKLFKIPVNGYTLLTAALGGIALIGTLILCMNYNHPFTSQARFYFTTTPIVPGVSGVVIDVPVEPGVPLKAGDVLFRVDPEPFENTVRAKEAALADAIQGTGQLEATAKAAQKQFESSTSTRETAKDTFDRFNKLKDTGAISKSEFEKAKNDYNAAISSSDAAEASAERALLNSQANVGGVNTRVASLQAELDTAKFNLAESIVRAPSDGVVSQMFLRPGMYAAALPLRPVMIFIPKEKPMFVGAFLQNSAQRIEQGSDAEIILPAVPGRFFKGKVSTVGAYITQGQLQPSGNLIDPEQIKGEGRMLVVIDFTDDLSKYQIVPGSNGEVAIYTHHMHHLAILRKVLLRMNSWLNYIFSDGH